MGVIFVPVSGDLYYSDKNIGSYKINLSNFSFDPETLLNNSKRLPIYSGNKPFTIVASRSHMSKDTDIFVNEMKEIHGEIETISKGSSLKLCMVAEGKADCYPRFAPTMEWDTAAGQAICEHAGFNVIDWVTKKSMTYNRKNLLNNWFLVK